MAVVEPQGLPPLREFVDPSLGDSTLLLILLSSAPLQAIGLAFLRLGGAHRKDVKAACKAVWRTPRILCRILGVPLLTIGLVLAIAEMLLGADAPGSKAATTQRKVSLICQCFQVPICYLLERYVLVRKPLPKMQTLICFVVWVGSATLEWARPWPADDPALVLQNQWAGCDDGFRALFTFVYVPMWLTCITFGVLVICCTKEDTVTDFGAKNLKDDAALAEEIDLEKGLEELDEEDDDEDHEHNHNHHQLPSDPGRRRLINRARRRLRERRRPMRIFRRCTLPLVHGFALTAASVILAIGWPLPHWRSWCSVGFVLVMLAVCCAWYWTQHLRLTLAVWASVSHCCLTLLRLFQSHLIFRNFQWPSEKGFGLLVGQTPGVYFYLFGVQCLLAVFLAYILTYPWREWTRSKAEGIGERMQNIDTSRLQPMRMSSSGHALENIMARAQTFNAHLTQELPTVPQQLKTGDVSLFWLRGILLPICFGCYVKGVTSPLYTYSICPPEVQWLNAKDALSAFQHSFSKANMHDATCIGKTMGFVDSITWLYDNHMPFSAMLAAYRSLIGPPLEFMALVFLLLKEHDYGNGPLLPTASPVPATVSNAIIDWLAGGAASKFATNCMVEILYVTIIQSADPGGNSFRAGFTRGFMYMMMYCVTYGVLVRSLEAKREKQDKMEKNRSVSLTREASGPMDMDITELNGSDEDEEEEDPRSWIIYLLLALVLMFVVAAALYFSITTTFIDLDFRYAGATVLQFQPVLLDLWKTLKEVDMPVACFAAATMVFFLLCRIVTWLLLHTIFRPSKKTNNCSVSAVLSAMEAFFKHYTLCHIWAESIILLWLAVLTRNRAKYQVCASLPSPPIGLAAIVVLGMGVPGLHTVTGLLSFSLGTTTKTTKSKSGLSWLLTRMPGGMAVWGLCPIVLFCFWAYTTHNLAPALQPPDWRVADINDILEEMLPALNTKIRSSVQESRGECWRLQQVKPNRHTDCAGTAPLVHLITESGWDVTVKWATGLNTAVVQSLLLDPPYWVDAGTGLQPDKQHWSLTASFVFTNLKIWVNATRGERAIAGWDDDMCCHQNFSMSVRASVDCNMDSGFGNIRLSMVHMDRVEMTSRAVSMPFGTLVVDYGDAKDISGVDLKEVLQSYLTGRVGGGKLLMKATEGSLDVLKFVQKRLQQVVELNTHPSQLCPQLPRNPDTTKPEPPDDDNGLPSLTLGGPQGAGVNPW